MTTPAAGGMRVLHVHSGNAFGGVESLLLTLARHRDAAPAVQAAFAVCFAGRLASELAALDAPPAMLGAVRIRQPWTVLRARRRLARRLRRDAGDVVVFHSPWAYLLLAGVARRAARRCVVWLHGPLRGRHWLDRLAARAAPDLAVCNSRFTERSLDVFSRRPPSAIVHPPVTPPAVAAGGRTASRAALGASGAEVVLVQVGRLDPMKGNREHLEALARLRDVPGWVSWHVGGPQTAPQQRHLRDLQSAARAHGLQDRVRFLGERRDIPRLLQAADVYVQPNTGPEGFGLSFVEAMLAGLPVVTSGCGGALEIVDRSCGVLVPPGDVDALAGALRALIRDPERRRALGAGGPGRARALCDPARQIAAASAALATLSPPAARATPQPAGVHRT